ncbi:MAG: FtsX-like permease family protein [Vicinamibacterales bacterium]
MRALTFAARSLLRQPGRTGLGILGIAAVGALLFDMLLLSRGLVVSFRDLLDGIGFDVRVTATDSPLPGGVRLNDSAALAAAVAGLPSVAEVVPMRTASGVLVQAGKRPESIGLTGMDPGRRRPWTLVSGREVASSSAREVVVNERVMQDLNVPLGSEVSIRVECDPGRVAPSPLTFTVVGVAQFPFDGEGQGTAAMSYGTLKDACGDQRNQADMLMVASKGTPAETVSAIRASQPDVYAVTNEQIVARMQAQNFTYFRQISAVLSTITLVFGFLLITVLLTVSVNQRLGEVAALRALGFSRGRAIADVLAQGAMLITVGGALALPLGMALSVWLDSILKSMPGIPAAMHFFVFEPQAVAWHVALLVVTALLASAYPMWLVARLPIAATLRNEVVG